MAFLDPDGLCSLNADDTWVDDGGAPCANGTSINVSASGDTSGVAGSLNMTAPPGTCLSYIIDGVPQSNSCGSGVQLFTVNVTTTPQAPVSKPPGLLTPELKKRLACVADVGVNYALSRIPFYAGFSAATGLELDPFKALASGNWSDVIGGTDVFGRAATLANGVSNLPDIRNAQVSAQRATDLVSRASFGTASAGRQAKLVQEAASAERLAHIANGIGKAASIFAGISYVYQAYECTQ